MSPGINRDPWTPEEDAVLKQQHAILGPKWAEIRAQIPGRTDVSLKNRWALITRGKKAQRTAPPPSDDWKKKETERVYDLFARRGNGAESDGASSSEVWDGD